MVIRERQGWSAQARVARDRRSPGLGQAACRSGQRGLPATGWLAQEAADLSDWMSSCQDVRGHPSAGEGWTIWPTCHRSLKRLL